MPFVTRKSILTLACAGMMAAPLTSSAVDAEAGRAKAQVCAACHGVDGNSVNPTWPILAGQHKGYLEKQLRDYREGRRRNEQMQAMAAPLSDEDITDLAAYFSQSSPKSAATSQETLARLGEKIYRYGKPGSNVPSCMGCHGPAGKGNPLAGYPSLYGQHSAYTEAQLKQLATGERDNDDNALMRTIAGRMTFAEIRAVSEYIMGLHQP